MAHPQIATFARLAKENTPPSRAIAGQATKLGRTMHSIAYDAIHDEIVVPNPFAQAILTFRGGADGNEPPVRVIQGPNTGLFTPDRLGVDPVHNEILVPQDDGIRVYPRLANGDTTPVRHLHGNWNVGGLVVDTVRDLIVARGGSAIVTFPRTADGEVKPRTRISGPNTGIESMRQVQVYPEKGYIFMAQTLEDDKLKPGGYFVGVWSIDDNGDVPPKWKIAGPQSQLVRARGLALNPKHNEVIVADMLRNAVLTFYYPEVFQ